MKWDVAECCKACHSCQMVAKPNKPIPVALLKPIPACGEPFSEVIIDCIGPFPKTTLGNKYLLTIMCKVTGFQRLFHLPILRLQRLSILLWSSSLSWIFTISAMGSGIQFHVWPDAVSTVPVRCQAVQIICLSPRIKGRSGKFPPKHTSNLICYKRNSTRIIRFQSF